MDTPCFIIGGDCNAKSPWWGHDVEDRRGAAYATYIAQQDLEVLNEGKVPTFQALRRDTMYSSIVDVTVCTQNLVNIVRNWKVDTDLVTTSDHRAITFNINCDRTELTANRISSTRLYNTSKADWDKFKRTLEQRLAEASVTQRKISLSTEPEEIDTLAIAYTSCIREACEESIPRVQPFTIKKPKWWTKELDERKADVIRKRRKIKKANPRRKPYVIEAYKKSLEEYKIDIVNARTDSWKKFCCSQERESVWDRIYRVMKLCGKPTEELLLNDKGKSLNARESAELLSNVFYPTDNPDDDEPQHKEIRKEVEETITHKVNGKQFIPIELQEIHHVMESISPKKAPGEDGLTADICFKAFLTTPEVLQALFNRCLYIGYFPKIWKRAVIKVIKKPGKQDYSQPKSYRPIGLLPVNGKVLEKIVCTRLLWSLGREGRLSNRQYGFVPEKSTEDALYDAINIIRTGQIEKKLVAVVSLDIEGAFDNAWWPGIVKELINNNCEPYILGLLTSYLKDRYVLIKYAGCESEKSTNKGCIQGSTGGPLMWNLQLDPLLKKAEGLGAHLQAFADDILIIAVAHTTEDLESQTNDALRLVSQWGRDKKMKFAAQKTKAVFITRRLKYDMPSLLLDGINLQFSPSLTLLGVTIDAGLTFREHLEKTANKAMNIFKLIAKSARATWGLNSDIVRLLYIAVVEPTILYAASVWAPVVDRKYARVRLDRLTRMFALKICKAHRTVSLNAGTILASILPLDLRAKENAELYQYKRGKPISSLPGRQLERLISPFNLPHPANRLRIPYDLISTAEDLEAITEKAPQLFTDGSKIDGKVGAAVSVWENGGEVASSTIKLADYCTVYQAELAAIKRAVEMIRKRKRGSTVYQIISDSRSALQSIEDGHSRNPLTAKIRHELEELRGANTQIQLFWIRAHEGMAGNERADALARKAALTKKSSPAYDAVPVAFAKWLIRSETLRTLQTRYEEDGAGCTTKYFFPDVRKAHRVLKTIKMDNKKCQLLTGHGGFGEYLHRFQLKPSPACECDGITPESLIHSLCHCPKFMSERTDLEIRTGASIAQQNLAGLLESDRDREAFMDFAIKIVNRVNKLNNSKIVM